MRVEARDGRGVVRGRVRRQQLVVLCVDGVELAGELLERRVGVADVEVAGLLQRGERFADAAYGELVGLNVEVVDGVVDELRGTDLDEHESSDSFVQKHTVAGSSARSIVTIV